MFFRKTSQFNRVRFFKEGTGTYGPNMLIKNSTCCGKRESDCTCKTPVSCCNG